MSLVDYAENELNILGLTEDDEMSGAMRKHLLHMVQEFANEGHSGFSANYALSLLKKLLDYRPLSPLTGEDDEWVDVSKESGHELWQNKRRFSIFKDGSGNTFDIEGKVFWEWFVDEESGEKHRTFYTCPDSRIPVTFPYVVPEEPIYEYRESE